MARPGIGASLAVRVKRNKTCSFSRIIHNFRGISTPWLFKVHQARPYLKVLKVLKVNLSATAHAQIESKCRTGLYPPLHPH